MATKKKTIKKVTAKKRVVAKKTTVEQIDLHQPFNLNDVSRETLENYALYLKEMTYSPGWKLMVQVLEGNLQVLERQIISKRQVLTNTPLSDADVDKLRDQHEILSELINKPQELIARYGKKEEGVPSPSYDPYGGDRKTVNAAVMSDST